MNDKQLYYYHIAYHYGYAKNSSSGVGSFRLGSSNDKINTDLIDEATDWLKENNEIGDSYVVQNIIRLEE